MSGLKMVRWFRVLAGMVFVAGGMLAQSADWEPATALPESGMHFDAVTSGGRVYVAGGYNGSNLSNIYVAEIAASGALQDWAIAGSLPQQDPGPGIAIYEGWLYAVLADGAVIRAEVQVTGALGSWIPEAGIDLTTANYSGAVKAYNGYLYVFGRVEGSIRNVVRVAAIQGNGSLGAWGTQGLPAPIHDAAVQFLNDRVYLTGGLMSGNLVVPFSYSAAVNGDGTFAFWRQEADLPVGLRAHASALVENRIYLFGGLTNTSSQGVSSTVYEGLISDAPEGVISNWAAAEVMPGEFLASMGAVFAARNGNVYALGGADASGNFTAEVWRKALVPGVATNAPPTAIPQSIAVSKNGFVEIILAGSDPDGDDLTFEVLTQPSHGSLTGTVPNLLYRPESNYVGTDSFTFKANDGRLDSEPATVDIEVQFVNQAPTANSQKVEANAGVLTAITLTALDPDGDSLSYILLSNPAHGTLAGTAPFLTYLAEAGYSGPDDFTFKVNDGDLDSDPATVLIQVRAASTTSPSEAVLMLRDAVANAAIPRQKKQPLLSSLNASAISLEKGNTKPGVAQLRAFQNKLRAILAPSNPDLAREWSELAQEVINSVLSGR